MVFIEGLTVNEAMTKMRLGYSIVAANNINNSKKNVNVQHAFMNPVRFNVATTEIVEDGFRLGSFVFPSTDNDNYDYDYDYAVIYTLPMAVH